MEVYPEKIDGTLNIMHYAQDVVYRPFFGLYMYLHPPKNYYSHSLHISKQIWLNDSRFQAWYFFHDIKAIIVFPNSSIYLTVYFNVLGPLGIYLG